MGDPLAIIEDSLFFISPIGKLRSVQYLRAEDVMHGIVEPAAEDHHLKAERADHNHGNLVHTGV